MVHSPASASADRHPLGTPAWPAALQSAASLAVVVPPATHAAPDFDQPAPRSQPQPSNASRRGSSQVAPLQPPTQSHSVVTGWPARSAQSTASLLLVLLPGLQPRSPFDQPSPAAHPHASAATPDRSLALSEHTPPLLQGPEPPLAAQRFALCEQLVPTEPCSHTVGAATPIALHCAWRRPESDIVHVSGSVPCGGCLPQQLCRQTHSSIDTNDERRSVCM